MSRYEKAKDIAITRKTVTGVFEEYPLIVQPNKLLATDTANNLVLIDKSAIEGSASYAFSSMSSSYSLTSSYALAANIMTQESSSWTSHSLSSSYSENAGVAYSINFIPANSLSSSFASSSLTASFLPNTTYQITSAYSENSNQLAGQLGQFYQTASNLLSGMLLPERLTGSYDITSSISNVSISSSYSTTSSYALNIPAINYNYATNSLSSSFASSSISSSYASISSIAYSINFTPTNTLSSSFSSASLTASFLPNTLHQITSAYALNSDQLDGQHGSYYLESANLIGYILPGMLTGSYNITSSWSTQSISCSYALTSSYLLNGGGLYNGSSSWSSQSLSSSYSTNASVAYSINFVPNNALTSSIASSSISASYSLTASYALNGGGQQGSSVSSSWASSSISSSYALNAGTAYSINFIPENALSSSVASSSLTSSFLPNATYQITSAYASNSEQLDGNQGQFYQTASNLLSGIIPVGRLTGSYNVTSSWSTSSISSSYAVTASYILNGSQGTSVSSSWSSQSLSSSYATNANLAYSINFTPTNALSSSFASSSLTSSFLPNSTYQITAAYASNSDQLDGQHGQYYQTASNLLSGYVSTTLLTGSYNITSSWSVISISSSHALTASYSLTGGQSTPSISSSWASSSISSSYSMTASYTPIQNGGIGITLNGNGSVLTAGNKGSLIIPYNCNIIGWTLTSDVAGNLIIDVCSGSYSNWPNSSSIAGSEKPTLSGVIKNQNNSLTNWTTSLSSGDILDFNVQSVSTITKASLIINVIKLS